MKKLRQYYLGYLSLLFLLFSTVVWGQIDITNKDGFYRISDTNDIISKSNNAEDSNLYLIVSETDQRIAKVPVTNNRLESSGATINNNNLSPKKYIMIDRTNTNDRIWMLDSRLFSPWYGIQSVYNNQFLVARSLFSDQMRLENSVGVLSHHHKWNLGDVNVIQNGVHGNLKYAPYSFLLGRNGINNAVLYRKLDLKNFNSQNAIIGQTLDFSNVSSLNVSNNNISISVISAQSTNNEVAPLYSLSGKQINFIKAGIFTIRAFVTNSTGKPNFFKDITIRVSAASSCFDAGFSENWNNDINNTTDLYTNTNNSPFEIVLNGSIYKFKNGIRMLENSKILTYNLGTPNGGRVFSNGVGTSGITVEFYVKKKAPNVSAKFKAYFASSSLPYNIQPNTEIKEFEITRDLQQSNLDYELIKYTYTGVTQYARLLIEITEGEVYFNDVRINCIPTNDVIWTANHQWTGGYPDITKNVIIRGTNFPSGYTGIFSKTLRIENDNFVVPTNRYLMVDENLTIPNDKKLEFSKKAYLFLGENAEVVGDVKFNTDIQYYRNDMKIVSSPIKDLLIQGSSSAYIPAELPVRKLKLNPGTRRWDNYPSNAFSKGLGVGILHNDGPQYRSNNIVSPQPLQLSFYGKVFNENEFTESLDLTGLTGRGKFTLGNPYSAPLNIERFLEDNEIVDYIELWKNDNYFDFVTNDYVNSSYWIKCSTLACTDPNYTFVDLGVGFIATLKNNPINGNITFNHGQKAFELTKQFSNNRLSSNKSKLYLSLNQGEFVHNRILFGYADDALDGYDSKYDTEYSNTNKSLLGILSNNKRLEIETRQSPLEDTDIIKLFFKSDKSDTFSIKLNEITNEFYNVNIYLKDNYNNIYVNLSENNEYTFESVSGDFTDRFEIHFNDQLLNVPEIKINEVLVYHKNRRINVSSPIVIKEYNVIDLEGRIIRKGFPNTKVFELDNLDKKSVIILKMISETNQIITKKIIN